MIVQENEFGNGMSHVIVGVGKSIRSVVGKISEDTGVRDRGSGKALQEKHRGQGLGIGGQERHYRKNIGVRDQGSRKALLENPDVAP